MLGAAILMLADAMSAGIAIPLIAVGIALSLGLIASLESA